MKIKKTVSIIGGGSSAYTLIALLTKSGYKINLLTRKPKYWEKYIFLEYQSKSGEIIEVLEGELNIVSDDPALVLENTDYIIFCLPVSYYKSVLNQIAPYIPNNKKVYLGTVYGQGGFNWMINKIKKERNLGKNLVTFAMGLIPWICRTKIYGKIGINYGVKARNIVAVNPLEEFENLNNTFLIDICQRWFETGKFYQAKNFISITLSVDNQIIHPSRMYGLYLKNPEGWSKKEEVPLFYRDFDDLSAEILKNVDDDYSKIRKKIKQDNPDSNFSYMLDYLALERFSYNSCNTNIKDSFTTSNTLNLIETPVVKNKDDRWQLNQNHRFFTDDIFYGLCIAKGYAEHFALKVPMIDKLLNWAEMMLGISILKNENLIRDSTFNGIEVGVFENANLSLQESLT